MATSIQLNTLADNNYLTTLYNTPNNVPFPCTNIPITDSKGCSYEIQNYSPFLLEIYDGKTMIDMIPPFAWLLSELPVTATITIIEPANFGLANNNYISCQTLDIHHQRVRGDFNLPITSTVTSNVKSTVTNGYVSSNSLVYLGNTKLNISNLAPGAFSSDFSLSALLGIYDGLMVYMESTNGYTYNFENASNGGNTTYMDSIVYQTQSIANQTGKNGYSNAIATLAGAASFNKVCGSLSPTGYQDVPVPNYNFETITGTAQVFADALTSYTGTTVPAPWTRQAGSWSFGTGGATSTSNTAIMTAGNINWSPMTGTGGQHLSFTVQATFTEPATVSSNSAGAVYLWHDGNNYYYCYINSSGMSISKVQNASFTQLVHATVTISASTSYTTTLAIDDSHNLTAKLYQGTNTNGTLLQTLTTTDSTIPSGYLAGVAGDTNVVVSNSSVNAPFFDSWSLTNDARVAWAISTNSISGTYSPNAKGVSNTIQSNLQSTAINVTGSKTYTASGMISSSNNTTGFSNIEIYNGSSYPSSSNATGTTSPTRYEVTTLSGGTQASTNIFLVVKGDGSFTFDNIHLEQATGATVSSDTVSIDIYAMKSQVQAYSSTDSPLYNQASTGEFDTTYYFNQTVTASTADQTFNILAASVGGFIKQITLNNYTMPYNSTNATYNGDIHITNAGSQIFKFSSSAMPTSGGSVWPQNPSQLYGSGTANQGLTLVFTGTPSTYSGNYTATGFIIVTQSAAPVVPKTIQ